MSANGIADVLPAAKRKVQVARHLGPAERLVVLLLIRAKMVGARGFEPRTSCAQARRIFLEALLLQHDF